VEPSRLNTYRLALATIALGSLLATAGALIQLAPSGGSSGLTALHEARKERVSLLVQATRDRKRIAELETEVARLNRPSKPARASRPDKKPTSLSQAPSVLQVHALERRLAKTNARLLATATRLTATRKRMSRLETVILSTPNKALALPLLKRDLDNQITVSHNDVAAVENDVNRQYDLMKWILGSLGLAVLAMVGSAVIPALRRASGDGSAVPAVAPVAADG
jgi:hypothetical protein